MSKNIFFFVTVFLFVCLFYNQEPGINVSIFSILTWLFLIIITPAKKRRLQFWLLSAASIVSILSFAWYADFISLFAIFISLTLTGFKAYYPGLNVIAVPLGVAFNYITFIFRVLTPAKWLGLSLKNGGWLKKVISYFIVPAILVAMFIGVYAAASAKFASFFLLDFEFDFFQILVLWVFGFFLMFNFFYTVVPKQMIFLNGLLKDDFSDQIIPKRIRGIHFLDIATQRRSGEISLALLNIVLCFFISTYCVEQFGSKSISNSLSAEVHERVYVLILSIVMAVVVIMVYFHGKLNFDIKSGVLKKLGYLWIGLNILLIVIVAFRNIEYVASYGLTFKRIGVFIFLLMSLIGLLITAYKIGYKKTNFFLINRMVWSLFSLLLVSCIINWSWIVTKYNTSHFENPDWNYLQSLNYNKELLNRTYLERGIGNSPILKKVSHHHKGKFLSKSLYYEFLNLKK